MLFDCCYDPQQTDGYGEVAAKKDDKEEFHGASAGKGGNHDMHASAFPVMLLLLCLSLCLIAACG